jgi:hypothetical protein
MQTGVKVSQYLLFRRTWPCCAEREGPHPTTPHTKHLSFLQNIRFGTEFSDHVLHVEHAVGTGWGLPKIVPFGFIPVHPAAQVFHYGMSCFEGDASSSLA